MAGPDIEGLTGLEVGFQAGEHARPTPRNPGCHRRIGIDLAMNHLEADHVLDGFNFECDARSVGRRGRISPRKDQAPWRRAFKYFANYPDRAPFPFPDMMPIGALLPV